MHTPLCDELGIEFPIFAFTHCRDVVVEVNGGTYTDEATGASTPLATPLRVVLNANGGSVLGGIRHPQGTADFASFLVRAKGSGAKAIGLA